MIEHDQRPGIYTGLTLPKRDRTYVPPFARICHGSSDAWNETRMMCPVGTLSGEPALLWAFGWENEWDDYTDPNGMHQTFGITPDLSNPDTFPTFIARTDAHLQNPEVLFDFGRDGLIDVWRIAGIPGTSDWLALVECAWGPREVFGVTLASGGWVLARLNYYGSVVWTAEWLMRDAETNPRYQALNAFVYPRLEVNVAADRIALSIGINEYAATWPIIVNTPLGSNVFTGSGNFKRQYLFLMDLTTGEGISEAWHEWEHINTNPAKPETAYGYPSFAVDDNGRAYYSWKSYNTSTTETVTMQPSGIAAPIVRYHTAFWWFTEPDDLTTGVEAATPQFASPTDGGTALHETGIPTIVAVGDRAFVYIDWFLNNLAGSWLTMGVSLTYFLTYIANTDAKWQFIFDVDLVNRSTGDRFREVWRRPNPAFAFRHWYFDTYYESGLTRVGNKVVLSLYGHDRLSANVGVTQLFHAGRHLDVMDFYEVVTACCIDAATGAEEWVWHCKPTSIWYAPAFGWAWPPMAWWSSDGAWYSMRPAFDTFSYGPNTGDVLSCDDVILGGIEQDEVYLWPVLIEVDQ